jgi:hypothetical protein
MRTKTCRRSSVGDGAPVVGWCRRPSSRRSVVEARWCQSPHFSASLIGLRVRVCGGAAGTVNIGSRVLASLSFIWRCARGPTATKRQTPLIRAHLRSRNRSRDNPGRSYPYIHFIFFAHSHSRPACDKNEPQVRSSNGC